MPRKSRPLNLPNPSNSATLSKPGKRIHCFIINPCNLWFNIGLLFLLTPLHLSNILTQCFKFLNALFEKTKIIPHFRVYFLWFPLWAIVGRVANFFFYKLALGRSACKSQAVSVVLDLSTLSYFPSFFIPFCTSSRSICRCEWSILQPAPGRQSSLSQKTGPESAQCGGGRARATLNIRASRRDAAQFTAVGSITFTQQQFRT